MKFSLAAVPAFILVLATPVFAGPASDAVAYFYGPAIGMEAAPENRDRFTGPAKAFLDASDEALKRDAICLDFGLAVDGQDFDEAEIAKSLTLEENVDADSVKVIAGFTNFGEPRRIEWTLLSETGAWKVSDIANPELGWRVSEFSCG